MPNFEGQVALVTGASRGIGEQVAQDLASQGAHVFLASRSLKDLERIAEEIACNGGMASAVELDVSEVDGPSKAIAAVLEECGQLDILINNAGVTRDGLLLRMKEEDWRAVMATNLDGTFRVTKSALTPMVRRRYGRIVNVGSVVGLMGNPGQTNYVASKAGVVGFTKALAREVAGRNITVNAIAPGFIETEMTQGISEKVKTELVKSIPVGRIGKPQEVSAGICFLASKQAGYITGHVLNMSGGMYM